MELVICFVLKNVVAKKKIWKYVEWPMQTFVILGLSLLYTRMYSWGQIQSLPSQCNRFISVHPRSTCAGTTEGTWCDYFLLSNSLDIVTTGFGYVHHSVMNEWFSLFIRIRAWVSYAARDCIFFRADMFSVIVVSCVGWFEASSMHLV